MKCYHLDNIVLELNTLVLVNYLNQWTTAMDMGKPVDIVYLVFQKAFDQVPHARLISKIRFYGINGKLLKFFVK